MSNRLRWIIVGGSVVLVMVLVAGVLWLRQRASVGLSPAALPPSAAPSAVPSAVPSAGPVRTGGGGVVSTTGDVQQIKAQQEETVKSLQAQPAATPPASLYGPGALHRPTPANTTTTPPLITSAVSSAATATAAIPYGSLDNDHDGLTNDQEAQIGTDPNNPDTDGDGLLDGEEVMKYHTNPLKADTDGDGLTDGDEVHKYKTDPLNPDTDGDGFTDGNEVKNGYNPLGPGRCPNPGCIVP